MCPFQYVYVFILTQKMQKNNCDILTNCLFKHIRKKELTFCPKSDTIHSEVSLLKITSIKAQWPEDQGFFVHRPDTGNEYIFIHFLSPAVLHSSYCDIPVQPGACILYDKHACQHLSAPDNALMCDLFHLQGDLTDKMERYDLRFNQIYYPTDSFAVAEIVRAMEREFLRKSVFHEDFCNAKITELLLTLAHHTLHPTSTRLSDNTRVLLKATRKTILSRYAENWDIEAMAKLANMRRSAFYDAYRQLFGISPKQDLISCRIEHAKYMLLQREYSVEQVAQKCGYTSTCHFIRQFKAQTGATPGKYICL